MAWNSLEFEWPMKDVPKSKARIQFCGHVDNGSQDCFGCASAKSGGIADEMPYPHLYLY